MEENILQLLVEDGSPPVIRAAGDLNYENCNGLGELIRETLGICGTTVALALGDLDFIDSSGLRILVKAAQEAGEIGCRLRLVSITPQLNHMLDVAGFRHLFEVYSPTSEAEAILAFHHVTARALSFEIPASSGACRDGRDKVGEFSKYLGLGTTELDDIKLAVGEAISNAVRHGTCGEGCIRVECRSDSRRLQISLRYPSAYFDPHSVPVPEPESLAEGGMGIHFMRLVMDVVAYEFQDGHAILTLEKHFSPRK